MVEIIIYNDSTNNNNNNNKFRKITLSSDGIKYNVLTLACILKEVEGFFFCVSSILSGGGIYQRVYQ